MLIGQMNGDLREHNKSNKDILILKILDHLTLSDIIENVKNAFTLNYVFINKEE